ncbi:somatostatin receptor type 5-like [Amphiura filiformis]|uniref:somatostatin receptor type 5-like n=1 Tax=Amphiura filiformis TaxID=82378 RepID=UPI003B21408F
MEPDYITWTDVLNTTTFTSTSELKTTTNSTTSPPTTTLGDIIKTTDLGTTSNVTSMSSTPAPYVLAYGELVFASVILIIILIAGIIGNSMIIFSVIFSRKLRTSTNAFVVSLAVADLLTSLFLPWYVTAFLGKDGWPLPRAEWLCGATGFMVFTCGIIVVFLLAGIGGFGYETVDYPSCSDLDDINGAGVFNLVQVVVGFPIPLVTIIVCYTLIYIHIRRHFKNKMARQLSQMNHMKTATGDAENCNHHEEQLTEIAKQELQITKNLFLVVCAFFACFLPFFVANAIPNAGHFVFYASLPTFGNSAINFGIYASRHPQFKVVLGCMIKCKYADIPEPSNVLKAILGR